MLLGAASAPDPSTADRIEATLRGWRAARDGSQSRNQIGRPTEKVRFVGSRAPTSRSAAEAVNPR
jgi:hypothetical protein